MVLSQLWEDISPPPNQDTDPETGGPLAAVTLHPQAKVAKGGSWHKASRGRFGEQKPLPGPSAIAWWHIHLFIEHSWAGHCAEHALSTLRLCIFTGKLGKELRLRESLGNCPRLESNPGNSASGRPDLASPSPS